MYGQSVIPVQRPAVGEAELSAVGKVFESAWLGMGAVVKEFEDRLRELTGAKHVVAVNTGTAALHITFDSLGLQPGDEVVMPSLTFVAAAQAIVAARLRPVFCEVEPETLNIDIADALSRVGSRTRAVMPVHTGGLVCDLDELLPAAKERNLRVVEDAAHAFGSTYRGRPLGSISDVTCFSFDPIKNITCGEGGAVTTNDDEIAERIVTRRILGIDNDTWSRYQNRRNWFYEVTGPGYRYHMANINAAIGLEQLKRADEFRARKVKLVRRYDECFKSQEGLALIRRDLDHTFPFFYQVRVLGGLRDEMMDFLKREGVASGVHYIPNHIQPYFAEFADRLPVTEQVFAEILTLPLFVEMTDGEQEQVVTAVEKFLSA